MIVIGLTGGIGSGKSTLLSWFKSKGIPVFESDKVANELLNTKLREEVSLHFGANLYATGSLDTQALAALVFENNNLLRTLNSIVHPAVAHAFTLFLKTNRNAKAVVKEAAILFETGAYKQCDFMILVCAPKEERIARVMKRDSVSREAVIARMNRQWSDAKKRILADAVIENINLEEATHQLEQLLKEQLEGL
ncbi:MAG: dephospho-CoA kinase [Flavobacteriaceae bacterium]